MQNVFENIIECLKKRQEEHLAAMYRGEGILATTLNESRAFENSAAIEIVKQAAKEYNNGWIPASQPPEIAEREDGKTEVVILQCKDGSVNIGTYRDNGFYLMCMQNGTGYMVKDDNIVYWQPFPKPINISDTWKQHTMNRFERVE